MSNIMKFYLVGAGSRKPGAELFHADGRADTMKLIVTFRNFVNSPKISAFSPDEQWLR
jgi:hypothetical protein